MKAIEKHLHHRQHLLFLDLEGTQFSHEMIAFGAIKVTLKKDGTITRQYKGIKRYVRPKNTIGNFVVKLTGITKEKLAAEGIGYDEAIKAIKNYCGPHFSKMAFVTFGTHDLRILMQSLHYSPEAEEAAVKHMAKYHVDMSAVLGQFIRDDKNNPLSLTNYLKVFGQSFEGQAHDPLDDAANLIKVYKSCFTQPEVIFDEYLKVLAQMRHLPDPLLDVLQKLIKDEDVTAAYFKGKVKEFIG